MREVMCCLQQELNDSPADTKAHRILQFMVKTKLLDLDQGKHEPQVFGRSALLLNVEGEVKGLTTNPATWLTPGLLERFLESRQSAVLARVKAASLDMMPVIRTNEGKGGKGIERSYWLDVAPLPEAEMQESTAQAHPRIEYQRSQSGEVKPSWFMRLIFRNGELKNRSWRGGALLASVLLGILIWAVWFFTGLWGVSGLDDALTLRQLAGAIFYGFCGWLIWIGFYSPFMRLVDDRVVKAPATLLAFWEDAAELEMHRDSEKQQWTRFVRFSGVCPLCSGRVLLMPGKPDFRLPLVGRCSESPHAHVFSFDRARLSGVYLGPRDT